MNSSSKSGSAPAPLSPGKRLGNYEILERLGAGGMGEVYRARDTRLGREVAIKTVSLEGHSREDALSRFEQEARSASALNHPNIVTIYELGDANGTHYIAMELVDGMTVREMIAGGPIPFHKAVAIAAQVADALAKAHEIGIVHRDLKPDNLMVTADATAKVLDFGLAKLLAPETSRKHSDNTTISQPLTDPGTVMGTIGYMSPEQTSGGEVDFRSDQFSLGSVLFEMITGHAAFQGKSHAETIASILRDEPATLNPAMMQAPAPFCWIVERCLAKDPARRYASTRDLARDLAAVRDQMADARVERSDARPNNLPVQRTTLVGREREGNALRQMLAREDVRMVTLTGPGGIGKTRLALKVAEELAGAFPGGVCFVALQTVSDTGLIPSTIAQALALREAGNRSAPENVKDYLQRLSQPMLMVVDNFEHLVSAAPIIANLITVAPKLKIIVTSQSPLHVYGEHEFPVPPLVLPNPTHKTSIEVLSRLPAIALFVERAQAVKRDFTLTAENASAICAICSRLDGLPLAIELAAARIKLLSPAGMLARLESSLNLLTGGARDLPTRQQTLRGTVDWSYGLLNSAEQTLFRRLSVFVGGCTLEAVEAACDTQGDLGLDVFDGMASLVDKSLAQQVEQAGEARFFMLSTIREYALERLAESGEEADTRRAHAAYYLVLAEDGAADTAQDDWLDRFEIEHDNFRMALDYLIKTSQVEWAMRLASALFRFWETRDHITEGHEYLGRVLQLEGVSAFPKLRSRLLFAAAVLAVVQGDPPRARSLFEESLETCLELKDTRGVAVALNALAVNARERGDLTLSALLFERCVGIWKDLGGAGNIARAISNLAGVIKSQGDYARAASLYNECLTMFREAGEETGVAWTLNYLGDLAREKADFAGAHTFYEQALAGFKRARDGWGTASVLSDLAGLSCEQGDYDVARQLYGESLRTFQELGYKRGIARVLECVAASAAVQACAELSLRLAGAAAAIRERLGAPLSSAERPRVEKALETARQQLSSAAGLKAWMDGWAMPVEQAVQEAVGN